MSAAISVAPAEISENGEQAIVTVQLSAIPVYGATVAVDVSGAGTTATLGQDYEVPDATGGIVTLDFDGSSSQAFSVTSLSDALLEGPERAVFVIDGCTQLNQGGGDFPCEGGVGDSATLTILDATSAATIEATDPTASADGSDPGELKVRLLSPAPSPGVEVNYSVGGTAVPGVDYTPLVGDVFIPEGQSTANIPVEPIATGAENDSTVVVTLDPGADYAVGAPSSATVTILGVPAVPTATVEATDPNASKEGPDPGELTVKLNAPAPDPGIKVGYSVGGTAVPGEDYRPLVGNVLIPAGQSAAAVSVDPLPGDANGDTTVVLTLSPGPGYEVGDPSTATVTIRDIPDAVIDLSIESGNGQVASTGQPLQPFVLQATSDGAAAAGIPVLWTLETGDGTLSNSRSVTDAKGLASSILTPSADGEFVVKARIEGASESVEFRALMNPLSSLPGLTANQRIMGRTVETLCPRLNEISEQRTLNPGEQDLLTQCNTIIASSTSDPGAAAQAVAALTPEQASAPRKLATQVTGAQLDNVATRLTALRRGVRGISLGNLTVSVDGQSVSGSALSDLPGHLGATGGAASADDGYQFERLGIFINGNIDWGNKDRTSNEDGFDFTTLGITAGVDYRFLEGLVMGVALGYGNTDVDIDANGGDLDVKAWTGMLYGTYYATDHFYLEGSATYGWGDFDQTRNVSYGLLGEARQAKADYDGTQYAFMFGAGYDFIRGEGIFDVYGRLRYVQADLDGYREQGASGLDLDVSDQDSTSFKSILGVNYTRSISTAKAVLVPQGWLEWAHEFESGDDRVSGFFTNDPSRIPFALATDKFDSDYFRLGLGLGAQFGQGRTAFVSYEAAIGLNSYTEHTASLGVRLDF